jgi:hypothetical protein
MVMLTSVSVIYWGFIFVATLGVILGLLYGIYKWYMSSSDSASRAFAIIFGLGVGLTGLSILYSALTDPDKIVSNFLEGGRRKSLPRNRKPF